MLIYIYIYIYIRLSKARASLARYLPCVVVVLYLLHERFSLLRQRPASPLRVDNKIEQSRVGMYPSHGIRETASPVEMDSLGHD